MTTHDADKLGTPSQRRTMTTDPRAVGGAVVESGRKDGDGNNITNAGSSHLTTCIDGKWFVCDTQGKPFDMDQAFDNETDAKAEAMKHSNE